MRPVYYLLTAAGLAAGTAAGMFLRGIFFKNRAARFVAQLSLIAEERGPSKVRDPGDRALRDLIVEMNRILDAYARLREERVRFETARREWFAHVSHDIRTPLTSIIGYIDAVRDGVPATMRQKEEYIAVLKNKAEELRQMVESMFQFARLKTEEGESKVEVVDVAETLRRCAAEFAPLLERDGFTVDVRIPDDVPAHTACDRTKLERLFRNLIHNVLRHAREGGYLEVVLETERGTGRGEMPVEAGAVSTREPIVTAAGKVKLPGGGEYAAEIVTVTVIDRGPGIPAAVIDSVMRERRIRGGGFGLHIAKHIAESAGGGIRIECAADGGTAVTVSLPRAEPSGNGASPRR